MVDVDAARTLVGVLGNLISFGLFASPIPTFITIWRMKSVGEFKPDPYIATVLNCMMWTFYGLPIVHPDSLLVITINVTGFVMEMTYVTIFFIYSTPAGRKKITMYLAIEVIFMAIVVFLTLFFFHTTKDRSMIIGLLCIVFNILMYASPLTVMRKVIETKSVKYMPFTLSIANFCNGIVWACYALFKFDPYILVPNGLGVLSGSVQLFLYAKYYKTTEWDEVEDEEKPKEVQLSSRA